MSKYVLAVLVAGLFYVPGIFAAPEVIVPVVKADVLAIHDAAKSNDAVRAASGVGVVGRVWGYVKDGAVYAATSTADAVVNHPFITVGAVAAAVLADHNNNWSGLWRKGGGSDGAPGSSTSDSFQDHSTRTEVAVSGNNNNITVLVQSNPTESLK